ncbi:MAG: septal ring lytic transglycosylase RlpA family lipoprotein [Candidatus Liberibacter europaeus]|uniref:Endolytic peptidoglycan transglycosylase RlpA n=1 Tax=Candidatus Liberibacter europaeus TaxID=744859 RepID=A0A2T4VX21_9HYPH|nr:septal ring lytic transglycosylase RlpA family lipoprotein [Candidatus Liberibacter europaeus]PTL86321.1 MAG: septal ring lytic transglycosylase RlpA family lipoprotein [Candidatus Liberibacter europaeus]
MDISRFIYLNRIWLVIIVVLSVNSCSIIFSRKSTDQDVSEYFPESRYGVSASDRVAFGKTVPRGGGYYLLGKPYQIRGKWYVPREYISYSAIGMASWYGSAFHGRLTANGEIYDTEHLTAAHPTLPLPSYVRVTNLYNGLSLIVRVNDRGPYHDDRVIDLSSAAAKILQIENQGIAKVHIKYIGMAMLSGTDSKYLSSTVTQYKNPTLFPIGCQYRLSSKRIISLNDCSNSNLQKQFLSLKNKKKLHSVPTPTVHHKYEKSKTMQMTVPSQLEKYYQR